jgi:UDP-glucose 4-epimerase
MKCLVTGGSGFLGSYVADELTRKGHEVTIFDKKLSKWKKSNQKMITGNLLNYSLLKKVIKGKDIVFHFAALSDIGESLNQPIKTIKYNILATTYVLELCKIYKIKRLIHASTIYVNSEQGGFYRSSKKAAEDYIEEYHKRFKLNYTILRFGSIYGSRSGKYNGVNMIINNALQNNEISYVGSRKTIREYLHVTDAAKATVSVLEKKYKNQHIIVTGKDKIKLPDFLNFLKIILKTKKKIKFIKKKLVGHYIYSPYSYIPKVGKKIKIKKELNFKKEINNLINEIKNNKNL